MTPHARCWLLRISALSATALTWEGVRAADTLRVFRGIESALVWRVRVVTLCSAHHTALHDGKLMVEGSAATGLAFRHAAGTPYGALPSASAAGVQARAFQALRGLGFGEREAKQALNHCLDVSGTDLEAVVRHCLERLSARALSRAG